jgi:phosphate transport system substrate-binding protein
MSNTVSSHGSVAGLASADAGPIILAHNSAGASGKGEKDFRRRVLLLAALALGLGAQAATAAPAHLLITVPAGAGGADSLPAQLAAWRQTGVLSSVLLLESSAAKDAPFASLAVLEFPDEDTLLRWQQGGARELGAGLIATRADALVRGETSPRDSSKARFLVALYDVAAPAERYKEYAQGYIAPQMEGWRAERVLTSYTLFTARERAGAPWHSALVMEYRDDRALARRDEVKEAVRQKLAAANPAWKAWSDSKADIRSERSLTQCAWVELPAPDLSALPAYKPEAKVSGGLRIIGSELKGAVDLLAEGFTKFHPDAVVTTSHIPSSEGAIAALYFGLADVAPAGDDAKLTDLMPYYNTFRHLPLEVSIATGGYEKRGSLWAFAAVVSKDNPLTKISVEQLKRIFGAERTGGWEIVNDNYLYTSKYARGPETNIRKWDQLGLTGEYKGREIETFGYCAPGFAIYFERNWFHWSHKWNPNFKEYVEEKQATPDTAGYAVASQRPLEDLVRNKYAIGLAALMHVRNYTHVKVLPVSRTDGGPAIALTPENVANRTYPLIRDAFIYVNKAPGRPLDPRVREFLRFCLSREGQQIVAQAGFYFPLTPEYLREQLKKLD